MEPTDNQQTPKTKHKLTRSNYLILFVFVFFFFTAAIFAFLPFIKIKKSNQVAVLGARVSIPSHFTEPPHPGFKDKNLYACIIGNLNEERINNKSSRIFEHEVTDDELAALKTLNCGSDTPMPFKDRILDLSGLDKLTSLNSLYLQSNRIGDYDQKIDLSKNTTLKILVLTGNNLTDIDLSNNTALTYLGLDNNQLTEINLSKNILLGSVFLENNQLTTINLPNSATLKTLNIRNNQLTEINLSNNTALENIFLESNRLTAIDVSSNTALKWLRLIGNQLVEIDLSKNTALNQISLEGNQLATIDVSSNIALTELYLSNNKLATIIGLDKLNKLESFNITSNAKPMFFSASGSSDKKDNLVINNDYIFINPGYKISSLSLQLDMIKTALEKTWSKSSGVKAVFADRENNQLISDSLIKSGDYVWAESPRTTESQFVILGDVAHDGQVLFNDVVKAYHLSNQEQQDTKAIEFLAADVTGDGEVRFNDVIKIYHYSKGSLDSLW